ncbi:hypothetical protein V6N13_088110 [Hibiscus sabdariffa]
MHEYRLEGKKKLADRRIVQDSYMLHIVFKKDGMDPKDGAQYGAPFKEEEWSDNDDDDEINLAGTSSLCGMYTIVVVSASCVPESLCVGPTVDSSGIHTQPLVGHANDDVNCITVTDADANADADADAYVYTAPTSVDTLEGLMVVVESVPASLEAPQLTLVPQYQESNDNNIISIMLDAFTEDNGQMICDFTDSFIEATKICEEDDILSMLAAFTEVNNSINWCH